MDKVAVANHGCSITAEEIRDGDAKSGEVCAAANKANYRHDNVIDKGSYDGGESSTNDNTDGQIHNVALADKGFKFFDKLIFFKSLHNTNIILIGREVVKLLVKSFEVGTGGCEIGF